MTDITEEKARESGSILLIVAARLARRECLTPLHNLCELPQRVVSSRALRYAVERVEETLLREVDKIVTGHDRLSKKLKAAEERIAELEARIKPVEFRESVDADYCRNFAWEHVKTLVTTDGWSVGDKENFYGFFCWGWDMRRQFNEQRGAGISKGE